MRASRSPSVLLAGAGAVVLAFAAGAVDATEATRLVRVAPDAAAAVFRSEASLLVVREGEQVPGTPWTVRQVGTSGVVLAHGTLAAEGSLLLELRAGERIDPDLSPASATPKPVPAAVATHVIAQPDSQHGP